MRIYYQLLLPYLFFLSFSVSAQNVGNPICEDGDCAEELFKIELNQPLKPSTADKFSSQRTEAFKKAYLDFQKIKNPYTNDPSWQSKYQQSQIGGKSCIRHYQLESNFAHEYLQNPAFKTFVDAQGTESSEYAEKGFENSRRGINLSKRMNDNCPKEAKKAESSNGPSLEKLKQSYQNMGQQLGYFDAQGNLLKPLKSLDKPIEPDSEDLNNMKKKDQINLLKDKVSKLPVGAATKNKIGALKDELSKAKPKLGLFNKAMGLLGSRLGTFMPGPIGLSSKVKSINDALGLLKNFKSKLPFKDLLSKIGNLFNKGKDLAGKAKDLVGQSNKLKEQFDDLTQKGKQLQDKLDKQLKTADQLEETRKKLEDKQAELAQKLEDRPRRILDELIDQVGKTEKEANTLKEVNQKEEKLKDQLLDQLDQLEKEKNAVEKKLNELTGQLEDLEQVKDALDKDTTDAKTAVEEAKKVEEKIDELQTDLADLKPAETIESEIDDCENELKTMISKITGAGQKQNKLKDRLKQLFPRPGKLLAKLGELKIFQNKLKLPKDGIPIADKLLAKADGLLDKAGKLSANLELVTGKKTKVQEKIEGLDNKLENIQRTYDDKIANVDQLKADLTQLVLEKSGLKDQLDQTTEGLNSMENKVKDLIDRYNLFDEDSDCLDQQELEEKIDDLQAEQNEVEPDLAEIEETLDDLETQEVALEEETEVLSQEVELQADQAQEIQAEEAKIKEEFGQDLELEPVQLEEWAESFEVKRSYWDAVFHPDDEVVEGYKGRYFEVRLKDADQNVKLLFGPGEYFMRKTDFRNNYGPTIGAFVTEALNAMKQSDREKIKVFIQGSADISGQNTFSGNLDEAYFYDQIARLPQKDGGERFEGMTKEVSIPTNNFRNTHLPDLRGQFLKEMIQVYSKKLEPVVLEGAVKEVVNKGDRNAIIYLFIPEELTDR
ncbi:MAG: hypothetical protein Sapg2KO_25880 [Saprospiraceae bacterium]